MIDAAGVARVTLTTERWPAGLALSADARTLAMATWAEVSDYGRGWRARLELVDLATGARSTPVGEGSGITAIQGTVRASCEERVHDESGPLNVRAAPSARSAVAGTLAHRAAVQAGELRGRWRRVSAPVAGWVWAASLRRVCDAAP